MNAVEIRMPTDNQEGTQSIVGQWLKKPGETVRENEPLLEISTDKVTMEIASPASGILSEILKEANAEVHPGDLLGRISAGSAAHGKVHQVRSEQSPAVQTTARMPGSGSSCSGEFSPAVKHLLKSKQIDPSTIRGTGREGRITAHDVELAIDQQGKVPPAMSTSPKANLAGESASYRVTHSPMRRMIAAHMVASMHTAPHVTSLFEADLSAVTLHRNRMKEEFERRSVKLTYTTYFVAACVRALAAVPEVNSRWHDDHLEIFNDLNIGVGTAIDGGPGRDAGLIVPVIHRAQQLDLFGIASRLGEITARAREGKLTSEEVKNGTFTISNHGVSGSLLAAPIIINQPQSAILGIGKVEKRIVVEDRNGQDAMVIKPMIYVTLTIDHRALDGFKANAFLSTFVQTLEKGEF